MSHYILAVAGNAKLAVDVAFIDNEDEIQSEDFSFVLDRVPETPAERRASEVTGELIVRLAGIVH